MGTLIVSILMTFFVLVMVFTLAMCRSAALADRKLESLRTASDSARSSPDDVVEVELRSAYAD